MKMSGAADTTHRLRIVAQDPSIRIDGEVLMATVPVPAEPLGRGPWGYRVQVIDYDASSRTLIRPLEYQWDEQGHLIDPFAKTDPDQLIANPQFHQQNVYAIVMRTLAHFERVLGRRLSWGFRPHQIKVAPHAFVDANAYYSDREEGLFFGYFTGPDGPVYACLSHDIVAHETAHALLDGLRHEFIEPSSPDQAGFHEGFADLVALLSVFQHEETIARVLSLTPGSGSSPRTVPRSVLTSEAFVRNTLLALGEEFGSALYRIPGRALRSSYTTEANPGAYRDWQEPHRRGEILVAAMLQAFVRVWQARLQPLGVGGTGPLDRERVVEEGAAAAEHLLNIAIRGLDYTPPVHLDYGDYLSAILTVDGEVQPDDRRYKYRELLRDSFAAWGVHPSAKAPDPDRHELPPAEAGMWCRIDGNSLSYRGLHHEALLYDRDEVFRFVWENADTLMVQKEAYTEVLSVRPCRRLAPDGVPLRETVAEFRQFAELTKTEQRMRGLEQLAEEKGDDEDGTIKLTGGGTLVFDDFGRLKFYIRNSVLNLRRQAERLRYAYSSPLRRIPRGRRFAELHRLRALDSSLPASREEW